MSEIALGHDMIAVEDGLLFVQSEAGEYNATHAIEVGILLEQGLAHEVPGGVLLRWADWPIALNLGISSLTAHTQPSALLLEIDRVGELGRPAFEYVLRWYDGATLVPVNRVGAYVKMSDGRMLHLDGRTVQLTEAADFFNQLEPEERADPRKAYATLAKVHEAAAGAAVLLDRHLRNTAVLIPSTLGLSIKTHDDGTISFLPRLPGAPESGQFTAKFEGSLTIHPVESLTLADGRRVRVLLSDAQQEVLRRMQAVRRLGGPDAKRLSDAPEALFDGLGDAIDLTHIEREYGPRVIGVGALPKTTDVKAAQGPTIIQRMQPDGEKGEPEATVSAGGPMNPRRAAVAIDVLDSATGKLATIRLKTEEEIAKLHAVVSNAATAGESDCVFAGQRFKVDHALVEVLSRHLTNEGGQEHEEGEIGATGHLYLLINEHEETLTPELLVDAAAGEHATPLAELQLPAALGEQVTLQQHQTDGVRWLATCRSQAQRRGGVLADDMGLGKTVQALALLLARAPMGPALVVAPTSVCANWIDEAARFAPGLRARLYGSPEAREQILREACAGDLVVVSYTLLQQSVEAFAALRWATLVADEAQAIKNASAKRSQAIRELDADFRLALSGTPIENRLGELWAIMNFTNPGLLGSAQRFAERFVTPIERDRDLRAQRTLRRLIAPFVLRRLKSEVLDDLPARTETILHVNPEPDEAAHYELLRREALATALGAGNRDRINVLAQLTRLRRAACDPRLVDPGLGITGAKVSAFVELAQELVANRHKALVFSQFTDFLALLRAPIEAAGITSQYLDGGTPAAERARRIAAFQAGEGDLFFISLKAGGFGLNLTAADYVVIVDPWWNPAAEDQATGRAHRIGQHRPVTVYRLVNRGSIEERIVALHHDKRSLAQGILEDIDATALPSVQELVALLGDEPPLTPP